MFYYFILLSKQTGSEIFNIHKSLPKLSIRVLIARTYLSYAHKPLKVGIAA